MIPEWDDIPVLQIQRCQLLSGRDMGASRAKRAKDLAACQSDPKATQHLLASSTGFGFRDLPEAFHAIPRHSDPRSSLIKTPCPMSGNAPYSRGPSLRDFSEVLIGTSLKFLVVRGLLALTLALLILLVAFRLRLSIIVKPSGSNIVELTCYFPGTWLALFAPHMVLSIRAIPGCGCIASVLDDHWRFYHNCRRLCVNGGGLHPLDVYGL